MSYQISFTDYFEKKLKKLNKKYPSIISDLKNLANELSENPFLGESLGNSCYKIRLRIKSKNTGKSGGARVISCVKVVNRKIYLVSIYDKSEKEDISADELSVALNYLDLLLKLDEMK